jgi:hypothetical protein
MTGEANSDTQNLDTQVSTGSLPSQDFMEGELEHPVLAGHPALGDEEVSGPGATGEGDGDGGEKEGGETAGEPGETKPPETPTLKYKSHEEAERAYEEAQRKMHEATTQASQETAAREALQRELEELKAKADKGDEKPPEKQPPVSPGDRRAKLLSVATAANKKALAKIGELDRNDPDYADQVAEAWAEANAEAALSEDEIGRIVKKQVEAEREADRVAREQDTATRVWDKAVGLAEKAGLNMGDEDSADFILFDRFARKVPEDVKKGPLEKQVEWVVGQVRSRVGQAVQTDKQREEAARRAQNNNAVLDAGTRQPRTSPKPQAGNLDDDFEVVKQKRTL